MNIKLTFNKYFLFIQSFFTSSGKNLDNLLSFLKYDNK